MDTPARAATDPSAREVDRLRELVQTFVRSFGLLVTRQTPCGHPLSPSYGHALMVLLDRAQAQRPTQQADLGAVLGIDKSNVARLCARMEAAGHVVQERSPDDGRGRLVRLTSAGVRLARQLEHSSRDRFRRVASAVAASEREALFESLMRLNAAVQTLGDEQEKT